MLTRGRRAVNRRGARRLAVALECLGFLACLTSTARLSAAAPAEAKEAPDYFHHQVWSTEEGLPQASVHALLQSHDGYLWIATEDGAARFDGLAFRVLNHATVPAFTSDDFSCLAQDHAGDIWFGTSDGLIRKHGDEYKHFSERDGLPSGEIVALAANASDLLVLTTGGLAVWQVDHFKPITSNDVITGLTTTGQGSILVLKKGAVYRWADGQLVPTAMQTSAALLGAQISDKQAIWTFGSNFVQFSSPSEKKTKIWKTGTDLPGNRVQALYADPQGKTWIGTNRGLVSVEPASGFAIRKSEALAGESILSIYADREGDLWIGTEASGLHAFEPRRFATVPGSASEAATTVAAGKPGVMYFGTRDDGIFKADGVAGPIAANNLTSPVILSLASGPDGDLWAGTPDGINHINGAGVRHWTIADGLPDNFIRSVLVAADATLWAGTRFGLVHIAGKSVQTFTTADGLASNSIGPLLQVKSTPAASVLWIGTSAGLCRQANHRFRCLAAPYQASGNIVTALAGDRDGAVWVALHGHGLSFVKDDRIIPVPLSSIPEEIVGILADKLGFLWLRSARGLYRVQISALQACTTDSSACARVPVNTFGRSDGMQSDELAGEGISPLAEGPNGELWFATRRGIAMTDPQHLSADRVPPGVAITQVRVDGVEKPTSVPADVSPGHRQFTFEYAGLSLNNAAGTHCRYMLDGFDRGWVDAGTRRTAFYTNLPSRRYTFRVLCANSSGLWSSNEADFHFRVLRPWYRSVWIYLLAACLIALGILAFVQLRVRAERRRFALVLHERNRVAREVHDTLAQDLVSVALQVELASQHAKAGRLIEVSDQLTRTRSLVRQALDSARQSIWNLRANLSDESLPVRLTARVDNLRKTMTSARLRISGEYRSAAMTTENEVMRIANEAISNAERHSGATEVLIELSYGAHSLRLQVRDNGSGFDFATARGKPDHYGLRGLEERAALLKAHLTVESVTGEGTTVTLITPLETEKS